MKRKWTIVRMDFHGYAADLLEFEGTLEEAKKEAVDHGADALVRGTQIWNKPMGRIEEEPGDGEVICL